MTSGHSYVIEQIYTTYFIDLIHFFRILKCKKTDDESNDNLRY